MPEHIRKKDYFRGVIDGDGSLGFMASGEPFISLVTKSDELALGYLNYIKDVTGKIKKSSKNSRDNVYNIMLRAEDAQKLIRELYYDDCIALNRKKLKAMQILKWKRPKGLRKIISRSWDEYQDEYILNHSIKESMEKLNRTKSSIKSRLFRLRHKK